MRTFAILFTAAALAACAKEPTPSPAPGPGASAAGEDKAGATCTPIQHERLPEATLQKLVACVDLDALGQGKLVEVRSNDDLAALLTKHPGREGACKLEDVPAIDLSKVTLLGAFGTGGCNLALEPALCDAGDTTRYELTAASWGDCERLALQTLWITIPKADDRIAFTYSRKERAPAP